VEIIISFFIIHPFWEHFGLWATIGTQAIIFTVAILSVVIFKWDLCKVFPFKKPMIRQIFGIIILWICQIILANLVNYIAVYFLPQIAGGIQEFDNTIMSVPRYATFIITVILPPICEEFLHRGVIRYTFEEINNKWFRIAALGVAFGAFHMELSQFAATSVLGALAAYIVIETKNLFLTMILHMLQNFLVFLVIPLRLASGPMVTAAFDSYALIGIGEFFFLTTGVVFLLIWGDKLIHSKEYNREHKLSKKAKWAAAIFAAFCFISGICISFLVGV